ncbi:MAG: SIMPL domain-containing protein [Patescibacteria group bacterium]
MEKNQVNNLYKAGLAFLIILSVFVLAKTFFPRGGMHGAKGDVANTITLSGHGEVTAVPDIANVYFTISKDAATVKDAQAGVAVIEKKALDFLKSKGVADKDIKTADASFYPKYEYNQAVCPMDSGGVTMGKASPYYCPSGRQVLTGYTASESITVKIRNTDDAGAIMQGLGSTGVSNLSGPNFAIDDEDALKAEARRKAIDDAREKAEILAKDLGVRLGKIASFQEGGGYGGPIYYAKDAMLESAASPAPAVIPKGENTISSDVTITYEIR